MISDVLSEAVNDIDGYLNDTRFLDTYSGDLRERIIALRNDMHAMRKELDTPPDLEFNPVAIRQPESIREFQSIGRGLREAPEAQLTEGFELPPKGTIIAPLNLIEAFRSEPRQEVPGKMTIDETNLVVNKRTGAMGLQFKCSFKPESGE